MKSVIRTVGALALLFVLLCAGCGDAPAEPRVPGRESYAVTDITGTRLEFEKKPERIVSLSVSTDEILIDLVDKERIVAVTYLADDPGISCVTEKAKAIKKRAYGNSPEAVLAMRPDLVILPDFVKPEMIRSLRDLGLKVYVYKTAKNFEDIRKTIRDIGSVVGEDEQAGRLIEEMDMKLAKIKNKLGNIPVDRQRRVVLIRTNGVHYSPQSSFADICRGAMVRDAAAEIGGDKSFILSEEDVVRLNPDVFAVIDWNYDGKQDAGQQVRELMANPSYQTTTAVKEGRVVILPSARILGLSHYIAEGVEELSRAVYPERF